MHRYTVGSHQVTQFSSITRWFMLTFFLTFDILEAFDYIDANADDDTDTPCIIVQILTTMP